MNYAFVIRNDRCIGCHACSTACKAENAVPVGVHRTWVKTVETGRYPDVRRHFQVTRCNHCERPPCVEICPTRAMYRRPDGIVEFDPDRCIGCKACLQACPYDAIHIDPATGTAAKCHFCAHRVEVGLEPPCVVVCPEHAILAGDLDDPESEVSRALATHPVTVRRPEQGTRPKLFYVEGADVALDPRFTDPSPAGYAWSEAPPAGEGPIRIGRGRVAGELVRSAWDIHHKVPWHWPVPAYLVSKGIGAGVLLVAALGVLAGLAPATPAVMLTSAITALAMVALTAVFLVLDLERPERFAWVLLKSHTKSWLVRGAWILTAFGALLTGWCALEAGVVTGVIDPGQAGTIRPWLLGAGVPLAVLTAAYTAFLFGQAEGRDLWQSPLLPAHLVLQALGAGAGALLVVGGAVAMPEAWGALALLVLGAVVVLDLALFIPGEFAISHGTEGAREAALAIRRGRWRRHFWGGSIALGHVVPLLLLGAAWVPGAEGWVPWLGAGAGGAFLLGLWLHEVAWVEAPQRVRNS